MHYFEFAEKDATLYEVSKSMNTGLDEIIEVRKDMNSDGTVINVSRALIKFDLNYISESISSGLITSSSRTRFVLNLYDANSEQLNVSQKLYAYPISQSWEMGSGRAQASPVIEDGCSWNYRDGSTNASIWKGSTTTLLGVGFGSGNLTINGGNYDNQSVTIGGVDFVFVDPLGQYTNTSTQIFVASGSTTGSSTQNLTNAINSSTSSSLHGLSISASLQGNDNSAVVGSTFASGKLTINNGDYNNQEVTIGGVDFVFISGSLSIFDNSSTEIFVTSGSTTGSSINNLRNTINNTASASLHGLPISASFSGSNSSNWTHLMLSGSNQGTAANLTAASSSGLFVFGGGDNALEGGTSTGGTGGVPHQLVLSASVAGTAANYSTVSSSGLFVFGNETDALAGGTDVTTTLSAHGGTWYSGSGYEAHQNFTHEPSDVRMDVTDIVWNWVDGRVPNEGFMLKRSGSGDNSNSNVEEGNKTRYGNFIFFGRDTHTVYQPKLEVVWDDSKWSTGSLSPLSSDNLQDMVLHMRGLRPEYKEKSKVKFRVTGRERYPEKTYSTTGYNTGYTTVKTLPSGSTFYEIKDAYTEDVIVPFGTGSIVSCDSTGNYFNFWMNGLQSERFYRINYKVVSGSGTIDENVEFFDEKNSFKVVR
jgi:hypothetical protein|tara:strand:+ start:5603 stop:7543 length:1941 start_codon:yes stop_codon:yes gene_type:complete